MPDSLGPIPGGTQITDGRGVITTFFRLRWQELIAAFNTTPTVANTGLIANQNAAIVTTNVFTTETSGAYRLSYYVRKTAADGVSSSLQFTYGWTDNGAGLSESAAAVTIDATTAEQSGSKLVYADADSEITYAVAYVSNTPGAMVY